MSLQAQSPLWMGKTIGDRSLGVFIRVRPVHRLKEIVVKGQGLKLIRHGESLRVDEL